MSTSFDNERFKKELSFYKQVSIKDAVDYRMAGVLPIVDILGHPFIVNIKVGELLPKGNYSSAGLDLINGGWYDFQTNQHCFYYHTSQMKEANISPDITVLPKNVVLVKIPAPAQLDPIGMARKNKVEPAVYLKDFPQLIYHKAMIIPLEETILVDVVKSNKLKVIAGTSKLKLRKVRYKNKGPSL